jgi:hypothetical protein
MFMGSSPVHQSLASALCWLIQRYALSAVQVAPGIAIIYCAFRNNDAKFLVILAQLARDCSQWQAK